MATTKISQLESLSVLGSEDYLLVVDVSDTSMAPTGTDKKILGGSILNSLGAGQFGPTFDVTADGTTDDTLAVQSSVNAAITEGNGGTVTFPLGTIKLTSTVTISSVLGLVFKGLGMGTKFIWAGNNSTPMFKVIDCRECVFENFQIECEGSDLLCGIQQLRSGPSATVVSSFNTYRKIWIEGVAGNIYTGLWFGGPGAHDSNNDFNRIEDCIFNNYRDYGVRVSLTQCYNNIATNCQMNGVPEVLSLAGYFMEAGYLSIFGGGTSFNVTTIKVTGPSAYQPMIFSYLNCENDQIFLDLESYGIFTAEHCRWSGIGIVDAEPVILMKLEALNLTVDSCELGDFSGEKSFNIYSTTQQVTLRFTNNRVFMKRNTGASGSGQIYYNYFFVNCLPCVGGDSNNWFFNEDTLAQKPFPKAYSYFEVNSATPTITPAEHYFTENTLATTITNFVDSTRGRAGEAFLYIHFKDGNTTIQHNANIKLSGGTNFTGGVDQVITLKRIPGYYIGSGEYWTEVSRSVA